MTSAFANTWTEQEMQFIRDNWVTMSDREMAGALGRTDRAVVNRRVNMGITRRAGTKPWTLDEIAVLEEMWGSRPAPWIARRLQRTTTAVMQRAQVMGLEGQMAQGDMMSLQAVTEMMGLKNTGIVRAWIEKYGLKASRTSLTSAKRITGKRMSSMHYTIRIDDLLQWLQENLDRWDSRRIPAYGLGIEEPWLVQKREQDQTRAPIYRPWTDHEKQYLTMQMGRGIPYSRVAEGLGRSKKSVKAMGHQLGLVSGSEHKKTA